MSYTRLGAHYADTAPTPAPADIELIQRKTAVSAGAVTSLAVTLDAAATAGNLLIIRCSNRYTTEPIVLPAGFTDRVPSVGGNAALIIADKVAAGGETTLTITMTTARHCVMEVTEWSGIDTTSPFDSGKADLNTSSTTLQMDTGATPTTLRPDSLVLAAVFTAGTNGTLAAKVDGFARDSNLMSTGDSTANRSGLITSHLIATTVGAYRTTEEWTTNARFAQGVVIAYRGAAGADVVGPAWLNCGGITKTGVKVATRLNGSGTARIAYSTSADLSSPSYTASQALTSALPGIFTLSGLTAGTRYYYAVEVDGTIRGGIMVGTFKTAPAVDASSFFAAWAGCAETGSTHRVFDRLVAANPDLFFHLGDRHYADITTNNVALYRTAMEAAVTAGGQAELGRAVPINYVFDDHDFGGNVSSENSPGKPAAQQVFREYVPTHTLPVSDGIYRSMVYGRVRFITTDNRSFQTSTSVADTSAKTRLGATQKQWFKDECLAAKAAGQAICWVNSVPWIGPTFTPDDAWWSYDTERQELAAFFAANDLDGRLFIISSDAHAVQFDNGTNNAWGGFPVLHAGALDRSGLSKGGPYSEGSSPGNDRYGTLAFTDTGTDTITVIARGYAAGAQIQTVTFDLDLTTTGTSAVDIGDSAIDAVYLGSQAVTSLRLGATEVFA